ncbi:MAG: hypothetical protein ACTHM5_09990, partial [Ginsengibacter sp.]
RSSFLVLRNPSLFGWQGRLLFSFAFCNCVLKFLNHLNFDTVYFTASRKDYCYTFFLLLLAS